MLERVLENWLTNINEKVFQFPFCQMLLSEGYQVIHLRRHGPTEQGKDVLAIDPQGTPCAFQLKGSEGKITAKEWEKYQPQIRQLVEIPIQHPSINPNIPRRVFFVTNGELDEEVLREIIDVNPENERRGFPPLETIVKGQLLQRFLALQTNFWPGNLKNEKDLLELYLSNGKSCLNKSKLSSFLENIVLSNNSLSSRESVRLLASTAILTSHLLSPFYENNNHVAVIEGWMLYIAALSAFVENNNLQRKYWLPSINIAKRSIKIAFEEMWLSRF